MRKMRCTTACTAGVSERPGETQGRKSDSPHPLEHGLWPFRNTATLLQSVAEAAYAPSDANRLTATPLSRDFVNVRGCW